MCQSLGTTTTGDGVSDIHVALIERAAHTHADMNSTPHALTTQKRHTSPPPTFASASACLRALRCSASCCCRRLRTSFCCSYLCVYARVCVCKCVCTRRVDGRGCGSTQCGQVGGRKQVRQHTEFCRLAGAELQNAHWLVFSTNTPQRAPATRQTLNPTPPTTTLNTPHHHTQPANQQQTNSPHEVLLRGCVGLQQQLLAIYRQVVQEPERTQRPVSIVILTKPKAL